MIKNGNSREFSLSVLILVIFQITQKHSNFRLVASVEFQEIRTFQWHKWLILLFKRSLLKGNV